MFNKIKNILVELFLLNPIIFFVLIVGLSTINTMGLCFSLIMLVGRIWLFRTSNIRNTVFQNFLMTTGHAWDYSQATRIETKKYPDLKIWVAMIKGAPFVSVVPGKGVIITYDFLELTEKEFMAIIEHERTHFIHKHTFIIQLMNVCLGIGGILLGFRITTWNIHILTTAIAVVGLGYILGFILIFTGHICEITADRMAVKCGLGEELKQVLVRFYGWQPTTLTHPSMKNREVTIDKLIKKYKK